MKFWIMIFSAALFAGGTCLGVALHPKLAPKPAVAPRPAPEPWGGWRGDISVTRFASELGLSEEQDAELDRILEDTHRDSDAYGRAMRAAHDRARERVTGLLAAEQKTKLDALLIDERRRRSEGELKKAVDAYTRILSLSPEQVQAFSKALGESKARRHAWFGEEGKKHDRDAMRSHFRELKERQNAAIQAVLKPEQFVTYREIQELFER